MSEIRPDLEKPTLKYVAWQICTQVENIKFLTRVGHRWKKAGCYTTIRGLLALFPHNISITGHITCIW